MLTLARGTLAAALAAVAAISSAPPARADADPDPAAPHALGRVMTAGPGAQAITLLTSGGYGYTESVLGNGDSHHRFAGTLAAEGRPYPWLALALRLDGRFDMHVAPGQPTDRGLVGDPRAFVRVDGAPARGLRLGARAGVWLPGNHAPSLSASAISPEVVGVVSYVPPGRGLAFTANVGYRIDRSAASAPDAASLSAADRLALSVSTFDAVLLGAAATYGRGRAQGFVEASWDLLVGSGHPSAGSSPLRTAAGARLGIGERTGLEAAIEVSPSTRPDVSPLAALVPVPPRVAGWLGLSFRFDGAPSRSDARAGIDATPVAPAPRVDATPAIITLRGQVTAADGGELENLRVIVAGAEGESELALDTDHRFSLKGKPGDEVTITAEATSYTTGRKTVRFEPANDTLALALERSAPRGQLRGLVRSAKGATLAAEIQIESDGAGAATATDKPAAVKAENGRFEVDVAPGQYVVTISAPGYETQQRRVEVELDGVTLLNVDLRPTR